MSLDFISLGTFKDHFANALSVVEKPLGLSVADRRKHLHIIGQSDMGKSTLLEHCMTTDIGASRGFALIDPHGDLAEKIVERIPSWRRSEAGSEPPLFGLPNWRVLTITTGEKRMENMIAVSQHVTGGTAARVFAFAHEDLLMAQGCQSTSNFRPASASNTQPLFWLQSPLSRESAGGFRARRGVPSWLTQRGAWEGAPPGQRAGGGWGRVRSGS